MRGSGGARSNNATRARKCGGTNGHATEIFVFESLRYELSCVDPVGRFRIVRRQHCGVEDRAAAARTNKQRARQCDARRSGRNGKGHTEFDKDAKERAHEHL